MGESPHRLLELVFSSDDQDHLVCIQINCWVAGAMIDIVRVISGS